MKSIALPLHVQHGVARGLLRNGSLAVFGAVREVGYFYTKLALGTPPRHFSVIIDTGSTITYVPCSNCKHCGKHSDPAFDPKSSSTAVELSCTHPKCGTSCGVPPCTCNNNKCYYARTYAERSSSEGWLIEDAYSFPDNKTTTPLVFGCENGETGEIYRQMADGIMGMGNNYNAFQSQLVANGVIEDVFSLCFGFPAGGTLYLGAVPLPPDLVPIYTPLAAEFHMHYYNVHLEAITVANAPLAVQMTMFNVGYGTVMDSGTTFTYLPTAAFNAFSAAVAAYVEKKGLVRIPGADPAYQDICWKGAPVEFLDAGRVFPSAEFVFGGNCRLQLTPYRYLFMLRPGEYCLGIFDNGGSGALIGGITVRNVLVEYDRKNKRIGFIDVDCEKLRKHPSHHHPFHSHNLKPEGQNGTILGALGSILG